MSYINSPWPTDISFTPNNSNGITAVVNQPDQECPQVIKNLLYELGWNASISDPNSGELLFQKTMEFQTEGQYFRWYEAVAWEFYKFIKIADGNTDGSNI